MSKFFKDNFLTKIIIVITSILFALLICEIVYRIVSPYSFFSSYYPLSNLKGEIFNSQPQEYDKDLGYVYKKSFYSKNHENFGNKNFTTYNDRIRSNISNNIDYFNKNKFKQVIFNKNKAIIITGDSFIAGNEVGNHETLPAQLENLSNVRILNGGVGGYSFTQTVLLSEKLIIDKGINNLILSLIPEDLVRSEYSIYQGVPRPYYKSKNKLLIETNHIKEKQKF